MATSPSETVPEPNSVFHLITVAAAIVLLKLVDWAKLAFTSSARNRLANITKRWIFAQ
jgi:hypothetical protein